MSKQKRKAAARKAPKKKTTAAGKARPVGRLASASTSGGTTSQITIYLFRTGSGNRIRTAPQRAYAGPGHVEWTVVNLIDGTDVPVRITWPNGSPFTSEESIEIRSRSRISADGVKAGVYKYVVHAYDAHEDPEIEFPQN